MYLYYLHEPLLPEMMDFFLNEGFYRMHQTLFTTQIIQLSAQEHYPVYWLRVLLEGFTPDRRHRELMRRNTRFRITLHDSMILDEETEALYARYEGGMTFDAPPTATSFLMGEGTINFFPSKTWQVRDGSRLIAAGYFDTGAISAAGILNFYDPAYRKHSIGTWLYLETVRYAAEAGKQYFYPGYIAPGYPKFDYKLLAGKERTEVFDVEKHGWVGYEAALNGFMDGERGGQGAVHL